MKCIIVGSEAGNMVARVKDEIAAEMVAKGYAKYTCKAAWKRARRVAILHKQHNLDGRD